MLALGAANVAGSFFQSFPARHLRRQESFERSCPPDLRHPAQSIRG
ncbi:MAG: hypothetical protein ACLPV8_16160 [Steroidobacteraceae bacterium]